MPNCFLQITIHFPILNFRSNTIIWLVDCWVSPSDWSNAIVPWCVIDTQPNIKTNLICLFSLLSEQLFILFLSIPLLRIAKELWRWNKASSPSRSSSDSSQLQVFLLSNSPFVWFLPLDASLKNPLFMTCLTSHSPYREQLKLKLERTTASEWTLFPKWYVCIWNSSMSPQVASFYNLVKHCVVVLFLLFAWILTFH